MENFDFVVDTRPMAEQVSSVNRHVVNVGNAVVAMEAAVVQTQIETSKNICRNLDNGFFLLMRSQISQKSAAQLSIVNSKIALMAQISKSIDAKRYQMQKDFLMIKRRYVKLFNELDSELKIRIRKLDEPAMSTAEKRKALITNTFFTSPSTILLSGTEIQNTKQFALNARLKSKTKKSIEALYNNVYGTQIYTNRLNSILKDKTLKDNSDLYVPVLFSETDSFATTDSTLHQTIVSSYLSENAKQEAESFFASENVIDSVVQKSDSEKSMIKNEFLKYVSEDTSSDRVKKTMQELFEGSTL